MNEMNEKPRTDSIFELSAPYDNPYQGKARRVVFCCTAGLLRSPTAAYMGTMIHGMNTRCVGVHEAALQRLSVNLIEWANQIVFMKRDCFAQALETFEGSMAATELRRKAKVWHIEDDHDYMAPALMRDLAPKLAELHASPIYCAS